MPEISVIVPCYNVEKYLPHCLDSVFHQSFSDFEVICVNDGSTDNCAAILNEYAVKDIRLKVLTQENSGPSVARNNALAHAKGRYVMFLDSDDFIHPQCLEIAHYMAEKHQADLVCFNLTVNAKENFADKKYDAASIDGFITENPFFQAVSGGNRNKILCQACTKLFRKSVIDGIEFIPHIYYEDYPFVFSLLAKKPKTVIIPTQLYFYTTNPNSITHQITSVKHIVDYQAGINAICRIYQTEEFKKEFHIFKLKVIPSLLRHQLQCCKRAAPEAENMLNEALAKELIDFNNRGILSFRGHKLKHYLRYLYLMWKYR